MKCLQQIQFYPLEKVTRPVLPWPKDYDTAVAEMKLPLLLASTFTDDTRPSTVTKKTCLLCGWTYYYRPIRGREHLGVTSDVGTNHVYLCKPFPEHIQCHAQIVKELKQRDEHDKIQGRETVKRSLQSGEPNDTVDVELFSKKARLVGPFKKVRTREEVDFQWDRAAVSAGFPMSFFDNEEVRKSVLMTTECEENSTSSLITRTWGRSGK